MRYIVGIIPALVLMSFPSLVKAQDVTFDEDDVKFIKTLSMRDQYIKNVMP